MGFGVLRGPWGGATVELGGAGWVLGGFGVQLWDLGRTGRCGCAALGFGVQWGGRIPTF